MQTYRTTINNGNSASNSDWLTLSVLKGSRRDDWDILHSLALETPLVGVAGTISRHLRYKSSSKSDGSDHWNFF